MIYKFELTYKGTTTEVNQPKDFTEFKSEIKRDFMTGGVFYKYVSGDIRLGFIGQGRTILENAYQLEGIDADVTLTISKKPDQYSTFTQVFQGKAIFENRTYNIDYFEVDFEQIESIEKIKNRIDIKIKLDETNDLDGNTITPPTPYSIPFHSKGIQKKSIWRNNGDLPDSDPDGTFPSYSAGVTYFPHDNVLTDNLGDITIFGDGGIFRTAAPTSFSPQIELTEDGLTTVSYDQNLDLQLTCTVPVADAISVTYQLILAHYDNDDVLKNSYVLETDTQGINPSGTSTSYDWGEFTLSGSQDINGVKGDKIRFYYVFNGSGANNTLTINTFIRDSLSEWNVAQITKYVETNVNIFTYHQVFSHVCKAISGLDFYSDYLGLTEYGYPVDGCAGLNGFTGGYYLRGVDTAPTVSLKDLLEDVLLRWGLGWSVEDNEYGTRLRVEPLEYFYKDDLIVDLGSEIVDYTETVNEEIPNEVVLGYKKYATQERFDAVIDDYCTEVQFSTPIIKKKKKFELKTSIISSPYIIEFTRRVGTIQEGWKYDEDVFHVDLIRGYDGATYEFAPRKTEDFTNISGLIDPDNPYNLHHHPVYFFFNQGMYLNSWMYGKAQEAIYRNQFFAVNKNLEAEYTGDCNHLEPLITVGTDDNYQIDQVNQGLSLFTTDVINFKKALTNQEVTDIINNHENNGTKNYGYFQFTDPDGIVKQGYLINLKYNPIDEIGEFELYKRREGIYEA